ncbi:hypothetical protein [Lactiplantibacillus modestisalitolerans]|uniref:Lipoprotein n=1 Tax=Lactiplantibacillus modestisalitolerans TaxID=1457219 RepID=A0ABV5WSE4_9LACO|nr:hypothetical protein [Lactiplantibacillus modestisalitolerans]
MKHFALIIAASGLLLLTGCRSTAASGLSAHQQNAVAAANRSQAAQRQDAQSDAAASHQTGRQYQATDDHITSATKAGAAVSQVLNQPQDQLIIPVPTSSTDGQGHHYYQVNSFQRRADGKRGAPLKSYFVYPNGNITTRQLD